MATAYDPNDLIGAADRMNQRRRNKGWSRQEFLKFFDLTFMQGVPRLKAEKIIDQEMYEKGLITKDQIGSDSMIDENIYIQQYQSIWKETYSAKDLNP